MKCLFCGFDDSKVVDSRDTSNGKAIRRRRECIRCGKRFTTYESIETVPVLIIKRNHSRQAFSYDKLRQSIFLACDKRPVSIDDIDNIAKEIEKDIYNASKQEIESSVIGDMVIRKLRMVDEIAAVRFATVFKKFNKISDLSDYLSKF